VGNTKKIAVLFLCTGNSCRSQMAEGFCRHLRGKEFKAYSAGIEKHGRNPLAVKVMREVGVDISGHQSKTLDELDDVMFDVVITVCGHANETCPVFPGNARRIYHGFEDPPKLAANARNEEEALQHYRLVRDDIRTYIAGLSLA
jgi:arsenate reductase